MRGETMERERNLKPSIVLPYDIRGRRALIVPAIVLFGLVVLGALIVVPVYGYWYGYTWLDWTMFGLLYLVTGLGITVGYHRLISHRSFQCPNWIKAPLLVAGGWALENSAAEPPVVIEAASKPTVDTVLAPGLAPRAKKLVEFSVRISLRPPDWTGTPSR